MSTRLTAACPGHTSGCTPTHARHMAGSAGAGRGCPGPGARGPWEAWLVPTRGQKFPHMTQEEKMPAVSSRTDSANLILSLSVLILFSVELSAEVQFVHQRRPWAGRAALSADWGRPTSMRDQPGAGPSSGGTSGEGMCDLTYPPPHHHPTHKPPKHRPGF